ncbi:MAG: DUF3419 family protein [Brumimicrobium sp.]|nr:DUF3419 family protein [Brumimicrobium sp.]
MKQVKKHIIRYANCWEDPDVLLSSLKIAPGDRVLSVGSAGDNSFALLSGDPEIVDAVDLNPLQIHLINLKREAIRQLEREEYLRFSGFEESSERMKVYNSLRTELPAESRLFWDNSSKIIESGLIHSGKFEKYFRFFARRVVPLIHSSMTVDKLLKSKEESEQLLFYKNIWENKRWKWLFKLFFSEWVLGRFGRHPSLFDEVEISVADFIYEQTAQHLSSVGCQKNYFLHYILKGSFGDELPYYVKKESYGRIKQNIDKLNTGVGSVEEYAKKMNHYNKFNLSNIFEYMDENAFNKSSEILCSSADKGARLAYWNLMVNRDISEIRQDVSKSQMNIFFDKGFFYKSFHINLVR